MSQMNQRTTIPFENIIGPREDSSPLALYNSSIWEQYSLYQQRNQWNRDNEAAYLSYLDNNYSSVREGLRRETEDASVQFFRNMIDVASAANYDLSNGLFSLDYVNSDENGPRLVPATQATYNRMFLLASGMENRSSLGGYAATGSGRSLDAVMLDRVPQGPVKDAIMDLIERVGGQDMVAAFGEDRQVVHAVPGVFNDLLFRLRDENRSLKFLGGEAARGYLPVIQYEDATWSGGKKPDEVLSPAQQDLWDHLTNPEDNPLWANLLKFANIGPEILQGTNNVGHAMYKINSTLLSTSITQHRQNFNDFEAFAYTLPTMLIDDAETAIELGLSAAAMTVSSIVPGAGFVVGAAVSANALRRMRRVTDAVQDISKLSRVIAGGIRGFQNTSKATSRVSKIINPFEFVSEFGMPALSGLRAVARKQNTFKGGYAASKIRESQDKLYNWRQFLIGSALEGGISEFGAYFGNLADSIEVADSLYGEGNHLIGFNMADLVLGMGAGAGFGVVLGSTMRGVFSGAQGLSSFALTPLATKVMNNLDTNPNGIMMQSIKGYRKLAFQAHAQDVVNLSNPDTLNAIDRMFFEEEPLFGESLTQADLLEGARIVSQQHRKSGKEPMSAEEFVDAVRLAAKNNVEKLRMAANSIINKNRVQRRKLNRDLKRQLKATKRGPQESRDAASRRVQEIEEELSELDTQSAQAEAQRRAIAAMTKTEAEDADKAALKLSTEEPQPAAPTPSSPTAPRQTTPIEQVPTSFETLGLQPLKAVVGPLKQKQKAVVQEFFDLLNAQNFDNMVSRVNEGAFMDSPQENQLLRGVLTEDTLGPLKSFVTKNNRAPQIKDLKKVTDKDLTEAAKAEEDPFGDKPGGRPEDLEFDANMAKGMYDKFIKAYVEKQQTVTAVDYDRVIKEFKDSFLSLKVEKGLVDKLEELTKRYPEVIRMFSPEYFWTLRYVFRTGQGPNIPELSSTSFEMAGAAAAGALTGAPTEPPAEPEVTPTVNESVPSEGGEALLTEPTPEPISVEDTAVEAPAKPDESAEAKARQEKINERKSLVARLDELDTSNLAGLVIKEGQVRATRERDYYLGVIEKQRDAGNTEIDVNIARAFFPHLEATIKAKGKKGVISLDVLEETVEDIYKTMMESSRKVNLDNINTALFRVLYNNDKAFDEMMYSDESFGQGIFSRLMKIESLDRPNAVGKKTEQEMNQLRERLRKAATGKKNKSTDNIPNTVTIEDFLSSSGARRAILEVRLLTETVSALQTAAEFNNDGKLSIKDMVRSVPPGFEKLVDQITMNIKPDTDNRFKYSDVVAEFAALALVREQDPKFGNYYTSFLDQVGTQAEIVRIQKRAGRGEKYTDEGLATVLNHIDKELSIGKIMARRIQEENGDAVNGASSVESWEAMAINLGESALKGGWQFGIDISKLQSRYGKLTRTQEESTRGYDIDDINKLVDAVIEDFNQEFASEVSGEVTPFQALGNGELDFVDPATAIVALLQAASGNPEGHATSFQQKITEFDASDVPIPSKKAKGTVVVNEFSPTKTAQRLLMYEDFVFQDRINNILFEKTKDGKMRRRKMTEEDMDIAEAWITMEPQRRLSSNEQEAVDRFGFKEPDFEPINENTLTTEKDKELANIWNKMKPEDRHLSEAEVKAIQIYGRKYFGTDMVVRDRKGSMRLVPTRAIGSFDEVIPDYPMYLANAYLDMLKFPPGLIRTTHDQFNLLKENGFLFGAPGADMPGMGDLFTPYVRTDSGVKVRGVTGGMATGQVAPGSLGDMFNRAAELAFPNLMGVAERARRSWHNAVKSDDFKKMSKELFGIEDITVTEEFQIARAQADRIRAKRQRDVETNQPNATLMSDEEYAETVGIIYTMTASEWDANASGNSIMMASTIKKNDMYRYLESDERYSELLTKDKNLVDQYKQVYDHMRKVIRKEKDLLPPEEMEAIEWWLDKVFTEDGLAPNTAEWDEVRKGLIKGSNAVLAKTYGIGYSRVRENIAVYLEEYHPELDADTRIYYSKVLAKRMSFVRGAAVSNLVGDALGLPGSAQLRENFFAGNTVRVEVAEGSGNKKPLPIEVNFEKAIMAEPGREAIGEGTITRIIGDMYPEDSLNETRKANLKVVLQIARQMYQISSLIENDPKGAEALKNMGIKTDFPSLLRQALKNYSEIIESSIEQATKDGVPERALDYVKARLARASQRSLKVDGMNALRRSAIQADEDMVAEYARMAGFDIEDMDPRTRLAISEHMYSDWFISQENRQFTFDGTMGTEPTRIQSEEKPGGIFDIVSDPYGGRTVKEAAMDVRQRAIEQALIDASQFKRFADGDDPTMEDFYNSIGDRNIQPSDTDFRVKFDQMEDKLRGFEAEVDLLNRSLSTEADATQRAVLREKIASKQKSIAMINAWKKAFAKNNMNHNPNLAGRIQVFGNDITPDAGSKNLSFSSQQDGFHGAFPDYAKKSLREVLGIPALRKFALARSRFGLNIKKSLNDNPPVLDTNNDVLSVPSLWTNKEPITGSLRDLVQGPGLTGLTIPERAVQIQVRLIRAAEATPPGSHLRKMVEAEEWDKAYVYVARKEIKQRSYARAQVAFETFDTTRVKNKEEAVAQIMFKMKTEEENEFQTMFSGFASSSERREVSVFEMDPLNVVAKVGAGNTWSEFFLNTGALSGSQAERSNLISWVNKEPSHVTRVIYEGTSGTLLEDDIAGGRGERADTALNALMAFHTDSFQIVVPSALWARLLEGQFYARIDQPSPIVDKNGKFLSWKDAIDQGIITEQSAILQFTKELGADGNGREVIVDMVKQMNRNAGDSAFEDINLIDNWGIKIDIVDDRESVPVSDKEAEVLERLSFGTLSIDSKNVEGDDQNLNIVTNTNNRLLDDPTKTFVNAFGEMLRTNKIQGDIRVSLTKDQKLASLMYSRNQDLVRDAQILRQFNLQQLNSREAESTRVSAYVPDILMDRTNLQQLPPGALDMHLRYQAQMDTRALQMMMGNKKIRAMSDATQSGMDDDGNIVTGTPAEYLNFEKYSKGNGMFEIDSLIEEDMAINFGISIGARNEKTKLALTLFHYGIPNRWSHLAVGIFGNNPAMRQRMSEGESLSYDNLPEHLKTDLMEIDSIAQDLTKQASRRQQDNILVWTRSNPNLSLDVLSEFETKTDLYYHLRNEVGSTMRFKDVLAITSKLFNDSDTLRQEKRRSKITQVDTPLKETKPKKPSRATLRETLKNPDDAFNAEVAKAQNNFTLLSEGIQNLRLNVSPEGRVSLTNMQELYKDLSKTSASNILEGDALIDFADAVIVDDPDNAINVDEIKSRKIFADSMRELGMTQDEINNMPELKDPEKWQKDKTKVVVMDIETAMDDSGDIIAVGILKKGESLDKPETLKNSIRFGVEDNGQRSAISSEQARQILQELEDLQNAGYKVVTFNGNNFDMPRILEAALRGVDAGSKQAADLRKQAARVSMRSIDMMQSVRSKHELAKFPSLANLAKAAQSDLPANARKLKSEDVKGSEIFDLWSQSNAGNKNSETKMMDYIVKDLDSTLTTFDSLVSRFEKKQNTSVTFKSGATTDFEPLELKQSFYESLKFRNQPSSYSINEVFQGLMNSSTETAFNLVKSRSLKDLTDPSKIFFNLAKVEDISLNKLNDSKNQGFVDENLDVVTEDQRSDLVNAIIDATGGKDRVSLLFQGSLIKTSANDPDFTSFNDLVVYLIDDARATGSITADSVDSYNRLVTLLTESAEVRSVLKDLEVVFSESSTTKYTVIPDQQGRTYGRIVLPIDGSFENTLTSLTHELIHHTVRSHILRMTGDEYSYFKESVFKFMFGTNGIANLDEAGQADIRAIKSIFDSLAKEAGVSQEISDLVVRTFGDLKKKGASHAELEYFLVQEFFAYGMTYAAFGKDIKKSRKTIELSDIMVRFLHDFKLASAPDTGTEVSGSVSEGIANFLFSQRKTLMDNFSEPDKPFNMTLYDQTNGARVDGNPYQDQIVSLSERLVRIDKARKSPKITKEQIAILDAEEASVRSALYRMSHTTERLANDLDIEKIADSVTGPDGAVDIDKIHDKTMTQAIVVNRLADLGARTEVDAEASRIQQIMDMLGASTTGMNVVRHHHLHVVRALGTLLNTDTWFAGGRYGAERGMITLQSISVMERGEVENLTQAFVVAKRSLNKAGFSDVEINEAFRLYSSDKSVGPKMDTQLFNGIKPVVEMFNRYIESVAQRAKDEGIINEKAYTALMNGNLPLRLKRSALESETQIQSIQFAIADNYRNRFLTQADNTPVSPIAVIGNGLIPSPRVFSKDILLERYKTLSERVVKWAEGETAADLDWSTDVVSRVQGALGLLRNRLKIAQITRKDLRELGLLELYDQTIDQPINGALITEYHKELGVDFIPESNITAAQYHAGRMMHYLRNNSYKFDDPFLDFASVSEDPILKPYLEFNPLQIVQGLRRGISHEAYERFMIRKTLGIRGLNYTDLIDYAESVTKTGSLVPTVEDGKVVTKILTKDDMRKVNTEVFRILREHRDTARGVFRKPESAGTIIDGLDKTSEYLTKVLSYPFWALASAVVEGGFAGTKIMGRALAGSAAEVHEAFASLGDVDKAKCLELLGMQIYNMTAAVDHARYGGQDIESLDIVLDMLEAEADGQLGAGTREELKTLAIKTGAKSVALSKMGFNAIQRNLRAIEVPNAIRKLNKDVHRFPAFIDLLDNFIQENGRNPSKDERKVLMRQSGLGNSSNDMNRLAKYMDSGLMDKKVLSSLKIMLADQSMETFSFDKAINKYVTFGKESDRDINLRALMAFREYLYRMATDTNLEVNVGDTQVMLSGHVAGRFLRRLTQYASLAFRMFRNLAFAAPASLALAYLSGYYILENLYSSLARIARGKDWREELERWTNFNEKPVETVMTYIAAGATLPQVMGFSAPIVSSALNSVVHTLGFDTPSRLLVPGGASTIGFSVALDALSGMRSIAHSFATDQPVDQAAVSDALALTSFGGFPSVLVRLGHSVSTTEQVGLSGQATARPGSQGFFYKPIEELYKGGNNYPYIPSKPGFGPIEKFRAEPYTVPKNTTSQQGVGGSLFDRAQSQPTQTEAGLTQATPPQPSPVQQPESEMFQENIQTTPGSLFDQR